jgi:hypothetical protein
LYIVEYLVEKQTNEFVGMISIWFNLSILTKSP